MLQIHILTVLILEELDDQVYKVKGTDYQIMSMNEESIVKSKRIRAFFKKPSTEAQ